VVSIHFLSLVLQFHCVYRAISYRHARSQGPRNQLATTFARLQFSRRCTAAAFSLFVKREEFVERLRPTALPADIAACRLPSIPRGLTVSDDRLDGVIAEERTANGRSGRRDQMWNNWFWKARAFWRARARRPLFGISQAHRLRVRERGPCGRPRAVMPPRAVVRPVTARQYHGDNEHRAECRLSLFYCLSPSSSALPVKWTGRDGRTRQWMLYTPNQWCAALLPFTPVARAFFGCFSCRSRRSERSIATVDG